MAHRIILADTLAIFRTGVARVLAMEEDLRIVAQCDNLHHLRDAIGSVRNSIALFPSSIAPDLGKLLDAVERAGSRSVVIVEHGVTLDGAIVQRIDGVVLRSVMGPQLVACLRRVAAGQRTIQQAEPALLPPDRIGARAVKRLTPRELQIVALVADGGRNREVATRLGIGEQVIKNHLRSVYDKVGVSDRLELTLFAQNHRAFGDAVARARQEVSPDT